MYRTFVPVEAMEQNSELTFGGSVNDVATVRRRLRRCSQAVHGLPSPVLRRMSVWPLASSRPRDRM